jgi:rhodanese-related sulfurtransferase
VDEVPTDTQIFVYCHHGMRSMQAHARLPRRPALQLP